MVQGAFMKDVQLAELDPATQFALWGFRSCAMGRSRCCCLIRQFDHAFGADRGGSVLGDVLRFAEALGNRGARRLTLGLPTSQRMTYDEASVIAALAAAQRGESELQEAHLTWLLAKRPDVELLEVTSRIGKAYADIGMRIVMPEEVKRSEKLRNTCLQTAIGQQ